MVIELSEIVNCRIDSVAPDTLLTDVARKMIARRTGTLAVCNEGRLVGVLTVHDLIVRTTSEGRNPSQATVSEVMSQKVVHCFEDEDPRVVLQRMRRNRLRQICVLGRNGRLLGTVSLRDLLLHLDESEAGRPSADASRSGDET